MPLSSQHAATQFKLSPAAGTRYRRDIPQTLSTQVRKELFERGYTTVGLPTDIGVASSALRRFIEHVANHPSTGPIFNEEPGSDGEANVGDGCR
jgi:hypothetical protein